MSSIAKMAQLDTMPCIFVSNNQATAVSDSFLKLTEYDKTDILGHSADNILYSLLRLNAGITEQHQNSKHLYIFTKNLEPREVDISIQATDDGILVVLCEKPHSRLDEKFPYLHQLYLADKTGIAIYHASDRTLLKANQTYMKILDNPYGRKDNCIGKRADEILQGHKGSILEEFRANLLRAGETFQAGEVVLEGEDKGVSYWDISMVPIYEDGNIKYIIENVTDVTERVLCRKRLEDENKKLRHQAEEKKIKQDIKQEIKEKAEELETVFETITDALVISDKDGKILAMNSNAKNTMGMLIKSGNIEFNFDEMQYMDINHQLIPLDEMPHKRAARGEKTSNFKFIAGPPGREKFIVSNVSPVFDAHGNFVLAVMCCRDITEHKKVEISLERSNRKFQELLSGIQDDVFVLDRNWNFVYANNRFASRLGKDPKYFIGNNLWHLFPEYLGTEYEEHVRAAMEKRELHRFDLRGKQSDTTFKTIVFPSEEGITVIAVDITEQLKQQWIIEFQRKQLEVTFNSMTDAVFLFDKDKKYFFTNKAARENYPQLQIDENGVSQQTAEWYTMDGVGIPPENMPAFRVLKGESILTYRFACKTPDKTLYFDVSGSPIYDGPSGNIVSGVLCYRDVTEQVNLEKAYKEQQQSLLYAEYSKNEVLEKSIKMKDEFLATISHEFKTPLSVINAAVQTIEKIHGNQLSDQVKKYLQRIRMNSFRQLRLVNNLLDITGYNAGYMKVNNRNLDIVFLSSAILKSVEPYARQKGVELIFLPEVDGREMALDEEKYERVLLNLLSNAIKFTPKGSRIYIHLSFKNRKAVITVTDEGIGIPRSKQDLIFERFGQVDNSLSRQAEGSGIGLSLVKTLVEGMKGTITVKSTMNQGSTFCVTLPAKKARHVEQQKDIHGLLDSRILQATAIEFSDIYLE